MQKAIIDNIVYPRVFPSKEDSTKVPEKDVGGTQPLTENAGSTNTNTTTPPGPAGRSLPTNNNESDGIEVLKINVTY